MLFNSLRFLIFFTIVILVYFLLPPPKYKKNLRQYWLLIASYYFYANWNAKYILLILFSTLTTYLSGLAIAKIQSYYSEYKKQQAMKKLIVVFSFTLNLSILFYFKYFNFTLNILHSLFSKINIEFPVPDLNITLPVGISFFTFQALSYTMDVYRNEIYAEKNFFKYALFVSFFPQLVAGPIERSKNLLKQLSLSAHFSFERARDGVLLMIWGYFLKIVIADRIAIFVDTIFNDITTYGGYYLVIAIILFSFQIYCDFYGYSVIAMGAAEILGVNLMENFHSPYLSTNVADFWRKWHISLTSWFRDYLYFPLGGSRKGVLRKYINKIIVFLISGLWHGASFSFIVWGGINGLYQVLGEMTAPLRNQSMHLLRLNKDSIGHKVLKAFITFILIDFSWLFFRAGSWTTSLDVLESIKSVHNPWILFDGSLYTCGLDSKNFWIMIVSILILLAVDICNHYGIKLRNIIVAQDYWCRWLMISVSVIAILIFGIWGTAYDASGFIYFQF
ncbi:MAG: MBOAT family protein [Lachnospiraceae bacterium]|nr:MBOAT family protein [Lachnospiraceae bacterium]